MLLEWKKWEELSCRAILMGGPNLENWGLKFSRAILRRQTKNFGVKNFSS
jgi:hypothetical protein